MMPGKKNTDERPNTIQYLDSRKRMKKTPERRDLSETEQELPKFEGQRWPGADLYKTHAVPIRYSEDGYVSLLTFSKEGKMKSVLNLEGANLKGKKLVKKVLPTWLSLYVKDYSEDLKEGKRPNLEFYFDDQTLKELFEKGILKIEKKGKKKFNKLKNTSKKELKKTSGISDSEAVELLALEKNYNSYIPDIGYGEFKNGFKAFLKGAAKGALVGLGIGAAVKLFSNLVSKYAILNNNLDNLNYSTDPGAFNSIMSELNGSQTLLGEIKGILDPLKTQVATAYANIGNAISDIGSAVVELDAVQSGIEGLKTIATSMGVDVEAINTSLTDGFSYVSDFLGYSTEIDGVATNLETQGASEMASATESFEVTYGTDTFDLGDLDIDVNGELDLPQSGYQGNADFIHDLVENGTLTDQGAELIADAYEKRTLLYQAGQQKLAAASTLRTMKKKSAQ